MADHDDATTRGHDHEVRNVLALLRGHLELAHESLLAGHTDEVAPDVADALAAARRLEALLVAPPPAGAPATGRGRHDRPSSATASPEGSSSSG